MEEKNILELINDVFTGIQRYQLAPTETNVEISHVCLAALREIHGKAVELTQKVDELQKENQGLKDKVEHLKGIAEERE